VICQQQLPLMLASDIRCCCYQVQCL